MTMNSTQPGDWQAGDSPAGDSRPGDSRAGDSPAGAAGRVVPCAGAVIRDDDGRLLLIRRRNPPGAGLWSLPGGRIEPGETDQQAVVREVAEETGLAVTCGPLIGTVRRPGLDGAVLDVRDYAAVVTGGTLAAGDDAADARWVTPAQAEAMARAGELTSGLVEVLWSWGVL
jgi:8-oxo-dGTP diphosphatase